jgi:hypothetical protein
MKACGEVDIQTHILLTSALVGGEWSASRLDRFTPRERASGAHWIRRLGGPQSQSGRRGEQKILAPTGDSNSDPSAVQPVANHYTDYANQAPQM